MFIPYDHDAIRFTGRWGLIHPSEGSKEGSAFVTTAPGACLEVALYGSLAVLRFDMTGCEHPYPHIWIQVDEGSLVESPVNPYVRVVVPDDGRQHKLTVIFKGAVEAQNRWFNPLVGKIAFLGLNVDEIGYLPADDRKTIEFIGDSITEGVLIDEYCRTEDTNDQLNRPYQDDSTATYAWLTAQALGLRPIIMGYGAVGFTHGGQGNIPAVMDAYPYCFDGCPVSGSSPDFIVINHGTNDSSSTVQEYITCYIDFLEMIKSRHPKAQIIVLSPFCGVFHEALGDMTDEYNRKNKTQILFVDTAGWIPLEPLHPHRDGHQAVAKRLTLVLKQTLGL